MIYTTLPRSIAAQEQTVKAEQTTIDERNARTSAREVAAFKARKRPHLKYSAYLTCDADGTHRITTWTGETLATVIAINSRRDTRSYVTNTRGSFWARGIDGRLYFGTHNGAGMYCRMRLSTRLPHSIAA
jgi:hypothetical protein